MPYPCWATFPFRATGAGETAPEEIAADSFALLKHGDPDGRWWMPAMSDAPLRGFGGHEWFWEPGDERLLYPVEALVDMYCRSVGHNSTLILGVTPDDRGLLPDDDVGRLEAFGAALEELLALPVARLAMPTRGRVVELSLHGTADLLVLQEDIRRASGSGPTRCRSTARARGARSPPGAVSGTSGSSAWRRPRKATRCASWSRRPAASLTCAPSRPTARPGSHSGGPASAARYPS